MRRSPVSERPQEVNIPIPPIHPEGHRFVFLFAVATAGLFYLYAPLGWIGVVLTLWCAFFFRDPARMVPQDDGLVIAPADGVVQSVISVVPPPELDLGDEEHTRVSIFMNVFNVHVNRMPVSGRIATLHYIKGKFLNAALDKASEDNERQLIAVETGDGARIGVVQIAGLVARRIVKFVEPGDELAAGERFGLIRFGSRVDVYLPPGLAPLVAVGQTSIAGETVIADRQLGETPRPAKSI